MLRRLNAFAGIRREDVVQVAIIISTLIAMSTAILLAQAQSQDFINGSVGEKISGLDLRVGRLERYGETLLVLIWTVIGGLGANLVVHIIEIRGRNKDRQRRVH